MTATVNGREYSRASLAEIFWSFGEMISYASRGTRVADRRRHRLGDVRHGLHPRARAGARRRRIPVAAARRRGGAERRPARLPPQPRRRRHAAACLCGEHAGRGLHPPPRRASRTGCASTRRATFPQDALTAPDPPTGERWEAGQVWAHVAEFIPYWLGEAALVVDSGRDAPVPFGQDQERPRPARRHRTRPEHRPGPAVAPGRARHRHPARVPHRARRVGLECARPPPHARRDGPGAHRRRVPCGPPRAARHPVGPAGPLTSPTGIDNPGP